MSDVTMQCLASLATGKALRAIDELCESQSRVATWKLSTIVATARSELGECAFQLRKSHDALLAERDQLRAELEATKKPSGKAPAELFAELYQILGELDAPENVLSQVQAATNGESIPEESLLPFFREGHDASTAAIQFTLALEAEREDGLAFLEMWNAGDFEAIRETWPTCPDEVFIGADPLFAPKEPAK